MPRQRWRKPGQTQTRSGRTGAGMGVNQMRTPNIAMIAAACGFDAIYIDLEHNPTSLETAAAICVAAPRHRCHSNRAGKLARRARRDAHPRLRRPGGHGSACQHGGRGAGGGREPAAIRRKATARRPAPGRRSATPRARQGEIAPPCSTSETLLMAMLETPEAIENADAIAAVDGIDVLAYRLLRSEHRDGHPRPVQARPHAARL